VTWKKRSVIRRVLKSLSNAVIRWSVKDLIADYEKTLEERDNLIEKLVYSESKYRTLFEDSLIPINICQDGKLREANPAWLKLHGYSDKAEVLGKDILDFVHPEDRSYMASRRRKWTDNRMRTVQIRDITQQGKVIDVEVYSSRIEYDETVATLSTLRDISALKKAEKKRKQLETRIQRAEKMEAIATLAGGVAHDLNNILSGIVGYPDLILMQLPDQSPLREPVRSMQDSGKKAAAIVQDLLTLARRGVMSAEILNLNQVVTDFLASPECIKMLSDHPGVAITHSLQPDLFNVKGSMAHLSKTVMNLLTNAAEAMPDGGEIRIETLNQAIDGTMQGFDAIPQGEYCVLVIADNGIGISETDKEKIFEPFYTKKKMGRSGTGLGMAVVWGTVKDHGGFVQLESAVNEGTTIKLFFPATHADQLAEHAAPELAGLRGRGEEILVVDDVQEQRDLAESMLTHMGYRVKTVASGEAAVDYITHCACDLVLLDMIMDPGIDGLATYREILKQRPGQKAVIMSGYSATDRVKALLKLGADTYIKKPFTLEQLGICIRETLDKPQPTPAD
jgi:PAS domain S-box-containing protein